MWDGHAHRPENDAIEPIEWVGFVTEKKRVRTTTRKNASAPGEEYGRFTEEERAAMRDHARELKAAALSPTGDAGDESAVLARIAELPASDRAMAERVHALIRTTAPELAPRLWYGMPAYAKDGKVLCFFQSAQKFKTRYATLGFSDKAALDEGQMWPTAFALKELTAADEARIAELVKRAVG